MKMTALNLTRVAAVLSLSALTTAQAAVTLMVDDNIKVTAINGQELKQGLFQDNTQKFTLQPGKHVITAKYDRLFNLRRDEHDYLRSANISVAADMADNQTYRLIMPNQPNDYESAKDYAKRPTLAVSQNGSIIASQQSSGGGNGGIFSGLNKALGNVFGGSSDAELQNQEVIAALDSKPVQAVQPSPTRAVVVQPTNQAAQAAQATKADTLDSFMQLWLKATPSERKKIRQWISQ